MVSKLSNVPERQHTKHNPCDATVHDAREPNRVCIHLKLSMGAAHCRMTHRCDGELRGVAVASQCIPHVVGTLSNVPERQHTKHNPYEARVHDARAQSSLYTSSYHCLGATHTAA